MGTTLIAAKIWVNIIAHVQVFFTSLILWEMTLCLLHCEYFVMLLSSSVITACVNAVINNKGILYHTVCSNKKVPIYYSKFMRKIDFNIFLYKLLTLKIAGPLAAKV